MFRPIFLCLILYFNFFTSIESADIKYVMAAHHSKETDCEQLERSDIKCSYISNGIDCLLAVENKRADFCRVSPEELLIAQSFINNVDIIAEIRDKTLFLNDSTYQLAIVINKSRVRGIKDLKGKRYCHPGNFDAKFVTNYALNAFERKVLIENNLVQKLCTRNGATYFENYIKTLAEHFGSSCRPNEINNDTIHENLDKLYPSLNNCPSTNEPGFELSMKCLVNDGDVAITSYHQFNEFFSRPEYQNRKQNYAYLCRNGAVNNLDNPCFWDKQPWDLIVAHRTKSEEVVNYLKSNLANEFLSDAIERRLPGKDVFLANVVVGEVESRIKVVEQSNRVPLRYFTYIGRQVPNDNEINLCKLKMNWCVNDAEREKCEWLRVASINLGLVPVINCTTAEDDLTCLRNVRSGIADITNLNDYAYVAERHKLEAIAFTASKSDARPSFVVLLGLNENFTSFKNYERKKACFPEFGGDEMAAFGRRIMDYKSGNYDASLLKLGDSCLPGLDEDHGVHYNADTDVLCNLCLSRTDSRANKNCNSEYGNAFYREGVLQCLGVGDFAVVNQNQFTIEEMSPYKVLCRNETIATFAGNDLVDEGCALTTIPVNRVVARKSNQLKDDYRLIFLSFEDYFVIRAPFEIFKEFNGTKDLLFNDSVGFEHRSNRYVSNYEILVSGLNDRIDDVSAGGFAKVPCFGMIFSIVLLYF